MSPGSGRRLLTAISSAATTSSVRSWSCIEQLVLHRPAYDAAAKDVENYRQVKKAFLFGWQIRDVGHPELIWRGCGKAPLDQIGRRGGGGIVPGRAHLDRPPAMAPYQSSLAQELRHPVVPAGQPACAEFGLDSESSIGAPALLVNLCHLLGQLGVAAARADGSRRRHAQNPLGETPSTRHIRRTR